MAKTKFKITAEANVNYAVVRIDGYIGGWMNCAADFKSKLDSIIGGGIKDVEVYINSEGGNVFEADEISNELQRFTGTKTARLGAKCMSAATKIACDCDKVIAAKNTSYMVHKPSGQMEGNVDEVNATLVLLKNKTDEYCAAYCDRTGMTAKEIADKWKEDWHMNAEQAKENGFVDEIEGEAEITEDDVEALGAMGIKMVATASAGSATGNGKINNNNLIEMKKELILIAIGAPADTADSTLMAILTSMKAKADKHDAMVAELGTMKTNAVEEKAEMTAQAAVDGKKITALEKPFFKKNLVSDFDGTKAILDAKPVLTALSAGIKPGDGTAAGEDRSRWTYDDWAEKDAEGLQAMATTDEPKLKVLFTAKYGKKAAESVFK